MASMNFLLPPIEDGSDTRQVVPVIDGVRLDQMVANFENARDFDPSGGYGGLVIDSFNFGDFGAYFHGAVDHRYFSELGKIAVLACGDCGELGCWPLYAAVTVEGDSVVWSDFEQPHRSDRDYTGFGPFEFEREQYEAAVERLLTQIN
jgi:hypothetical protein